MSRLTEPLSCPPAPAVKEPPGPLAELRPAQEYRGTSTARLAANGVEPKFKVKGDNSAGGMPMPRTNSHSHKAQFDPPSLPPCDTCPAPTGPVLEQISLYALQVGAWAGVGGGAAAGAAAAARQAVFAMIEGASSASASTSAACSAPASATASASDLQDAARAASGDGPAWAQPFLGASVRPVVTTTMNPGASLEVPAAAPPAQGQAEEQEQSQGLSRGRGLEPWADEGPDGAGAQDLPLPHLFSQVMKRRRTGWGPAAPVHTCAGAEGAERPPGQPLRSGSGGVGHASSGMPDPCQAACAGQAWAQFAGFKTRSPRWVVGAGWLAGWLCWLMGGGGWGGSCSVSCTYGKFTS